MRSNGQDQPSETERLRARVNRLEMRLERLNGDAPSDRTTATAFVGGTVALFLSPALPWIRTATCFIRECSGLQDGGASDPNRCTYASGPARRVRPPTIGT